MKKKAQQIKNKPVNKKGIKLFIKNTNHKR